MYKYHLIADSIREGIREGRFKPGEKLPSIQTAVKESGYNSDTVIKAYRLLEEEHLIYSTPRSGYYVVKSRYDRRRTEGEIDLNTVCPPDSIHPYKDFYHCMEKSITVYKNKLLEYDSPQGMEELRAVLVRHLMNFHIFTKSQDIFITNGAQQALYILSAMPFPGKGFKVAVEQPTYSIMLNALRCNNVPVIGIKRTKDGIDMGELEAAFKSGDIKFFYTMPRFQNPAGFSYSREEKQKIVQAAGRYGVYIVEDDYLADLELEDKADSLYAMGEKDRIVYIRSFSKTLLPGLRLGMTIVPEALQEGFSTFKKCMDLNTPVLTQGALEIYLKSSMYKSHVARTRSFYQKRMKALKEACESVFCGEVKYHIPVTGIYALIETEGDRSEIIAGRLKKSGILVSSIRNCYLEDFPQAEGIRLCICNWKEEDFLPVLQLIKEEMERIKKSDRYKRHPE